MASCFYALKKVKQATDHQYPVMDTDALWYLTHKEKCETTVKMGSGVFRSADLIIFDSIRKKHVLVKREAVLPL